MTLSRLAVGALGGVAATFAGLVGIVSLTRIAGDYLGFPPGLEWTFTGAVDVASIAGGIMWTAFDGPVRKIGRPMNIVCTVVSGVGVGLDHATHAGRALRNSGDLAAAEPWPWIAFAAGLFVPALATWILHALSIIFDAASRQQEIHQPRHQLTTSDTTSAGAGAVHQRAGEHQVTLVKLGTRGAAGEHPAIIAAPVPVPVAPAPARAAAPARPRTVAATTRSTAVSRRALEAAPVPRPEWLTDTQLDAVLRDIREARAEGKSYGRHRVMEEHGLNDPKAKALLAYIRDHRLLEEAS